jgi:hypothetical protein
MALIRHALRASLLGILGLVLAVSCGDGDSPLGGGSSNDDDDGSNISFNDTCRFSPDACFGNVGANCDNDNDCNDGFCCEENANCGGGMCTLDCNDDGDCPSFMRCEHNMCFFRCDNDSDCSDGQSCEHGETVCEWP